MQENITNLENYIDGLMKQYISSDGYLKELVKESIESRYDELRTYHRNLEEEYYFPKYQKISSFVSECLR